MDAAFMPLRQILDQMLAHLGEELVDDDAGVRSHIYECSIESPLTTMPRVSTICTTRLLPAPATMGLFVHLANFRPV